MKMLLQTCCAPCLSGSRISFEDEDIDITAYWYDPNIQPFSEHQKRLHTLERYLFLKPMKYIIEPGYEQNSYMVRQMEKLAANGMVDDCDIMSEKNRKVRCEMCYDIRLGKTADFAKKNGYDAISSTLLLSKHQDHEAIRRSSKKMADIHDVEFIYKDLRKNWKDSIRISKELELYRQPYCGCIFSEHERYASK